MITLTKGFLQHTLTHKHTYTHAGKAKIVNALRFNYSLMDTKKTDFPEALYDMTIKALGG